MTLIHHTTYAHTHTTHSFTQSYHSQPTQTQLHYFNSHLTLFALSSLTRNRTMTHTHDWTYAHTLEKKLNKAVIVPIDAANLF